MCGHFVDVVVEVVVDKLVVVVIMELVAGAE